RDADDQERGAGGAGDEARGDARDPRGLQGGARGGGSRQQAQGRERARGVHAQGRAGAQPEGDGGPVQRADRGAARDVQSRDARVARAGGEGARAARGDDLHHGDAAFGDDAARADFVVAPFGGDGRGGADADSE